MELAMKSRHAETCVPRFFAATWAERGKAIGQTVHRPPIYRTSLPIWLINFLTTIAHKRYHMSEAILLRAGVVGQEAMGYCNHAPHERRKQDSYFREIGQVTDRTLGTKSQPRKEGSRGKASGLPKLRFGGSGSTRGSAARSAERLRLSGARGHPPAPSAAPEGMALRRRGM